MCDLVGRLGYKLTIKGALLSVCCYSQIIKEKLQKKRKNYKKKKRIAEKEKKYNDRKEEEEL